MSGLKVRSKTLNLQRIIPLNLNFEENVPGLRLSIGDGWKITMVAPLKCMLAVLLISRIFMFQNYRYVFLCHVKFRMILKSGVRGPKSYTRKIPQ